MLDEQIAASTVSTTPPSIPASFQQRLAAPASRAAFDSDEALVDYAETLLHVPLDGEQLGNYRLPDSLEFRVRKTPFPTLQDLDVTPTPGSLFYSPQPRHEVLIEITDTAAENHPRPPTYPCRRYYRARGPSGNPTTRTIDQPITTSLLQDEYIPVPTPQPELDTDGIVWE